MFRNSAPQYTSNAGIENGRNNTMAGKATNNDTADMKRSFIRALLTADTEKVSQILEEHP